MIVREGDAETETSWPAALDGAVGVHAIQAESWARRFTSERVWGAHKTVGYSNSLAVACHLHAIPPSGRPRMRDGILDCG